jgi:hypothetical protein
MGRRLRLAALAATATVVASLLTGCTLATPTDETVWYLPATGAHGAENLPTRTIDLFLRHWNTDIPPPDPATDPAPPSPNGVCP